jgi:hypothetical protein
MVNTTILPIVFIIQIVLLYFITKKTINDLFYLFHVLFRSERIVFSLIAFLFFPGTIIHELSHFFMAMILFLRVRDIHIFPQWEGNYIKLGYVMYEKKDVFRSIIVGIAPVIVGLLFFWWMSALQPFQNPSLLFRTFLVYVIFIVSSTMFSSKQDLVDIVYIIPLFLIIGIILFVLKFNPLIYVLNNPELLANIQNFLYAINWYIFYSIIIHIVLISIIQLFKFFRK